LGRLLTLVLAGTAVAVYTSLFHCTFTEAKTLHNLSFQNYKEVPKVSA